MFVHCCTAGLPCTLTASGWSGHPEVKKIINQLCIDWCNRDSPHQTRPHQTQTRPCLPRTFLDLLEWEKKWEETLVWPEWYIQAQSTVREHRNRHIPCPDCWPENTIKRHESRWHTRTPAATFLFQRFQAAKPDHTSPYVLTLLQARRRLWRACVNWAKDYSAASAMWQFRLTHDQPS